MGRTCLVLDRRGRIRWLHGSRSIYFGMSFSMRDGSSARATLPILRGLLPGSPSPAARSPHRLPGNARDLRTCASTAPATGSHPHRSRSKCVDVLRAPTGEHTGRGQISIAEPPIGLPYLFPLHKKATIEQSHLISVLVACIGLLLWLTQSIRGQRMVNASWHLDLAADSAWLDTIQERER